MHIQYSELHDIEMVQICLICSLKNTNGKINPLSYHSSRLCKKLCKVKIMLKDKGQTGLPVLECAFQRVRVKRSVVQAFIQSWANRCIAVYFNQIQIRVLIMNGVLVPEKATDVSVVRFSRRVFQSPF